MEIFIEIGFILAITTVVSLFMRLLKQPLIVGYILSGIIVGPYFLDIISSTEYIELFSKLGIAILLFIVGLSLKPDIIREVGKISLVTGVGQVLATSLLGFFVMRLFGFDVMGSIYGAVALTFSSTIIILKLLSDKNDLDKLYGRISVGFLLVQDLVATIILLSVSVIGVSSGADTNKLEAGLMFLAKSVFAFVVIYILIKWVLPKITRFLATSQEALFLFSLAWGLGVAGVFYLLGFSLEIGALVAGVALSASLYSYEIVSRMKPLRDFFILIFFVMLGSHMVITGLGAILLPAIILSLFVMIGNPIIVVILMNLLGHKDKVGFMAGLTVAQISEFSLILVTLGHSLGHISQEIVSLVTLVGVITITGSTYMIIYAEKIYPKVEGIVKSLRIKKNASQGSKDDVENSHDLIIFGYDRVGYDFVRVAKETGYKYLVVDFNPESINNLKNKNTPYCFGDAEDVSFLEEIHVPSAKIVISTIPDFKTNLGLVSFYKNHNPEGIVIITSQDIKHTKELYKAGASFVVMPHYIGANFTTRLLKNHGLSHEAYEDERKKHMAYLAEREKVTS